MEEHDLGDEPEIVKKSWQDHDWTAEEVKFVSCMLRHGNKSRAVRETWPGQYSHTKLHHQASRVLAQPHIAEYLAAVRSEMAASMVVTKERILEEVARLAYANMSDFLVIEEDGRTYTDFSSLTREQLAAVQEVEIHTYVVPKGHPDEGRPVQAVKFKLAPKLPALDLLGKSQKLWTDVVETNTTLVDQAAIMRARRANKRKTDEQNSS